MSYRSILTVTSAATNRLLTQLSTVKTLMGLSDTTQDAKLNLLIPSASAAAENFCNRTFARDALSEKFQLNFDGIPWQAQQPKSIQLRRFPVVPAAGPIVLTLTENGTVLDPASDFEIDYDVGQITRLDAAGYPRSWPTGQLTVVYTAGYLLPADGGRNLPQEIEDAVIDITRARFNAINRDPALKSVSVPDVATETYFSGADMVEGISDYAKALLDNYRAPVVAR